jgi:hypothetical protein
LIEEGNGRSTLIDERAHVRAAFAGGLQKPDETILTRTADREA